MAEKLGKANQEGLIKQKDNGDKLRWYSQNFLQ